MELSKPVISNELTRQIRSFSCTKDDLKKLIEILQERCSTAADIEISKFQKGTQTDEQYESNKEILKRGFELDVVVKGKDGITLFGKVSDIFNSPNFPDEMASLFMNSAGFLTAVHNYHPRSLSDLPLHSP